MRTTLRTDQVRGKQGAGARHGTTDYWDKQTGFIPDDGEIIIYDDAVRIENDDGSVTLEPKIKIGTGNAYVQDLTFLNQQENDDLYKHIQNNTIHISGSDRLRWNNKLNVDDDYEVDDETLIFNRD